MIYCGSSVIIKIDRDKLPFAFYFPQKGGGGGGGGGGIVTKLLHPVATLTPMSQVSPEDRINSRQKFMLTPLCSNRSTL